ncbi:hypothetical protein LTR78_006637 [Recurvomyces mirabilis]|uniref:Heterokaryon incompatibility domain-containing protein n=2 Tax=Recurvomyces mirabilis TaxID=574656 RepID=A0AAE1BZQ5_9PEZI|nr:hypothetical protein LTR78_006637 [Recurvomyces mirabilis]
MRTVSLKSNPPPKFETTSYAWGDASIHDQIFVNGIPMMVTASSAAVLRRCRYQHSTRAIWIDAICIDQSEVGERNQQLTLMASIYRQCWRNIIYLGEPAPPVGSLQGGAQDITLTRALEDLIQYTMRHLNLESRAALEKYMWVGNIADIFAQSARHPPKNPQDLADLVKQVLPVFRASWFRRLWVIQESILPPENICCWGTETISLQTLLLAVRCIMSWEENLPKGTDKVIYAAYVLHTYTVIYAEPWANNGELLDALLTFSDHCEVTVPHDRLYGLLGLFQAAGSQDELPVLLRPDYSRSWIVVLADATKYIFQERRSLHVLNGVEHSKTSINDLAQPSWVGYLLESSSLGQLDGSQKFNASNGSPYQPHFLERPNELKVCGYTLGVVSEVALTQEKPTSSASLLKTYHTAYDMALRSSNDDQAGTSANEVVAYTLVGGKTWDRQRFTGNCHEICESAMARADLWPNGPPLGLAAAAEVPEGTNQEAARYAYAMWEAIPRRTFFCTDSFFGLGPPYISANDVLAVLLGYHLPVILRPVDGHGYRFVGPCYVHGIMDGEIVIKREADNILPELLVLI